MGILLPARSDFVGVKPRRDAEILTLRRRGAILGSSPVSSQFDLLLQDLRRVQNERPPSPPLMAKALPPADGRPTMGMIMHNFTFGGIDLKREAARLRDMARDIGKRLDGDREKNSGAAFFKSLGATRALVGKNLAAGKISPDDAIKAEAKLNRLFDRGVAIIAAEARS